MRILSPATCEFRGKNSHQHCTDKMSSQDIRHRVNASMLHTFQGDNVALMGVVKEIDNNGTSFQMESSDGQSVHIILNEPLSEDLTSLLVEVHGVVDNRNNINCQNYVPFTPEVTQSFDMETYNKAIKLSHSLKDHYIQGGPLEPME
ncbi:uncharacterized protein LOC106165443 [Lingula anatina]|uniref:Uncharacterized protein LOC106165443 n=1 Tax=Lingula anatina TaxID=7574 RepID=A0A1S3INJ3_LINAN|nr:uncharacterized protein LOC106165443 [Lingula anatina]|eukprot:XP_013399104.1 uncharacterized protein LOC106165443 [Lingula anatina]